MNKSQKGINTDCNLIVNGQRAICNTKERYLEVQGHLLSGMLKDKRSLMALTSVDYLR